MSESGSSYMYPPQTALPAGFWADIGAIYGANKSYLNVTMNYDTLNNTGRGWEALRRLRASPQLCRCEPQRRVRRGGGPEGRGALLPLLVRRTRPGGRTHQARARPIQRESDLPLNCSAK